MNLYDFKLFQLPNLKKQNKIHSYIKKFEIISLMYLLSIHIVWSFLNFNHLLVYYTKKQPIFIMNTVNHASQIYCFDNVTNEWF